MADFDGGGSSTPRRLDDRRWASLSEWGELRVFDVDGKQLGRVATGGPEPQPDAPPATYRIVGVDHE